MRYVTSIFAVLFMLFSLNDAQSATITSIASGNWSDKATWTNSTVPGVGDHARIAPGHTVVIPAGKPITVGDGSNSISILTGGNLLMNADLTLAGELTLWAEGNTNLTATLVQARDTTLNAQSNNIINGRCAGAGPAKSLWIINGAAGHRATVTGTTGKIDYYKTTARGGVDWRYATIDGFSHSNDANRVCGSVAPILVRHCIFKNAKSWLFEGSRLFAHVMDNNDFRNLAGGAKNIIWGNEVAVVTGLGEHQAPFSFRGNTFCQSDTNYPGMHVYVCSRGIDMAGCVIVSGGWYFTAPARISALSFLETSTGRESFCGNKDGHLEFDDCLFVSSPRRWNLHLLGGTVRNCILQGGSGEDNFSLGGPLMSHNLLIKDGAMALIFGAAPHQCPMTRVLNNTVQASAGVYGSLWYNETGQPRDYILVSGNIAGPGSTSTVMACALSQCSSPLRIDALDELGHNAYFNRGNPKYAKTYNLTSSAWTSGGKPAYVSSNAFSVAGDQTGAWTNGTRVRLTHADNKKRCLVASSSCDGKTTTVTTDDPFVESTLSKVEYSQGTNYSPYGTGDFGGTDLRGWVDPGFVDASRTVEKFAAMHGAPAATTNVHDLLCFVFGEFCKRNGADIEGKPAVAPAWDPDDLKLYLRAGFLPTNTVLWTAGEGGSYLGAISPYPPVIKGVTPDRLPHGAQDQVITITGSHLASGTVRFSTPGVSGGIAVFAGTQVTIPVSVASGASTGRGIVTVTTPAGTVSHEFRVDKTPVPAR